MKVISLDIETKNLDISNLNFNNPKGWKVSCVCIYDPTNPEDFRNYRYGDLNEIPFKAETTLEIKSWKQLKEDLEIWYQSDYILITKNGLNFDLPIISKGIKSGGCGVKEVIQQFEDSDRHLDLQKYLEDCTQGIRFSLQNLIVAVLGANESKLMAADEAPLSWESGDYLSVYEYCDADAKYTHDVWDRARRKGSIQAIGKKDGEEQNCYVRVKW